MDRPLAARLPRSRGTSLRAPRPATALAPLRLLARGAGVLLRRRRTRLALLLAACAAALLGGGWVWLRSSPLASVRHVRISGVRGPDAQAIDAALAAAARRMSTLDVKPAALRAAVAPYRVVREVRTSARFPHSLRITVEEQPPVAALVSGSGRSAVAADGVVLGPALLSGGLATLTAPSLPAAGTRIRAPSLLAPLAVLGAAPAPLARLVSRVYSGPRGLTLAMRGGLLAYFGDAARAHAKWLSLARVLADPSSQGASHVDVRVPERPAAGFPAGVTPPAAAEHPGGGGEASGASESTVGAIAAGLGEGAASSSPAGAGGGHAEAGEAGAAAGEAGSEASG